MFLVALRSSNPPAHGIRSSFEDIADISCGSSFPGDVRDLPTSIAHDLKRRGRESISSEQLLQRGRVAKFVHNRLPALNTFLLNFDARSTIFSGYVRVASDATAPMALARQYGNDTVAGTTQTAL
jgi:hypothetical protein